MLAQFHSSVFSVTIESNQQHKSDGKTDSIFFQIKSIILKKSFAFTIQNFDGNNWRYLKNL